MQQKVKLAMLALCYAPGVICPEIQTLSKKVAAGFRRERIHIHRGTVGRDTYVAERDHPQL